MAHAGNQLFLWCSNKKTLIKVASYAPSSMALYAMKVRVHEITKNELL